MLCASHGSGSARVSTEHHGEPTGFEGLLHSKDVPHLTAARADLMHGDLNVTVLVARQATVTCWGYLKILFNEH